jgi:hypothetical protein
MRRYTHHSAQINDTVCSGWGMIRVRGILILSLWMILLPRCCTAQIKHFGLTPTDQFKSCAAKVFGKPVLVNPGLVSLDSSCHSSDTPASLRGALSAAGELVADGPVFLYLTPLPQFDLYYGSTTRPVMIAWRPAIVSPQPLGCVPLPDGEIAKIGQIVLREARMPFFTAGTSAELVASRVGTNESKTGPVTGELRLELYDCQLKSGTQSVFGILGGSRLIYGEIRDDRFELLWDSPEFAGGGEAYYTLDLRDMTGDGVREILVPYNVPGGAESYDGIAIFDVDGNELDPGDDAFVGESFKYEPKPDGKVDVLVVNNERTDRYTLENGRYVLVKPAKRARAKADTRP